MRAFPYSYGAHSYLTLSYIHDNPSSFSDLALNLQIFSLCFPWNWYRGFSLCGTCRLLATILTFVDYPFLGAPLGGSPKRFPRNPPMDTSYTSAWPRIFGVQSTPTTPGNEFPITPLTSILPLAPKFKFSPHLSLLPYFYAPPPHGFHRIRLVPHLDSRWTSHFEPICQMVMHPLA